MMSRCLNCLNLDDNQSAQPQPNHELLDQGTTAAITSSDALEGSSSAGTSQAARGAAENLLRDVASTSNAGAPCGRTPTANKGAKDKVLKNGETQGNPERGVSATVGVPPFTEMMNGRYHVNNGYTIAGTAALRVLKNSRLTLVAKDMAQALWGNAVLCERSFGGRVAPRDKCNPGILPRKELTPAKVNRVIETEAHWGKMRHVTSQTQLRI
ncbi:uncharacterized protein LOC135372510 isoform X2 [Ornithodoros turicata]|uniref:uncharacterized protein LOC135372510 isoform X2 n=1 Tax=Ornithodoros turicata TaxID=34597 RepID=UPI003139D6C8